MRRFWTVVKTREASCGEAVRSLTAAAYVHYHPKTRFLQISNGTRIRRVLSLFPHYCFVQVTRKRCAISLLKGVEHVFRVGEGLAKIETSFIEKLQQSEDSLGYVDVDAMMHYREYLDDILPGEMVRGLYGLYVGQHGQFVDYDKTGKLIVRFSILGREIETLVDAHELVAA